MSTPFLDRSQAEIRIRFGSTSDHLRDLRRRLGEQAGDLWAIRHELMLRARRPLRKQPFDMLIGFLSVLLPLLVLVPLSSVLPITAPSLVLLIGVALATYVGDWTAGITSLLLTSTAVDLFWIKDKGRLDLPTGSDDIVTMVVIVVCGGLLIWLIQETKTRSLEDRREALAARAVATALNAIEASAAAHASGTAGGDRASLHDGLLRAMVSANRASVGALLMSEDNGETFGVAATYGVRAAPAEFDDLGPDFIRSIARDRRARMSTDVGIDTRLAGSIFTELRVRSVLGAPLISAADRLIGVVVTGVVARHQFTTTEINRLSALAEKGASILEAVVGYDRREIALQEMVQRQDWLVKVITAIPEAVILAKPTKNLITGSNDAALRLLGDVVDQGLDAIRGRLSLPDGEPVPGDVLSLSPSTNVEGDAASVELLVQRADGARIPVLLSIAPVPDEEDPDPTVVAVFREITVLKEASRLKDEFVSVVSHELRSPLTPIRGFVQLVARDLSREGGHQAQVERLESVASHVDRMTRLVDDLLDVSRLKAGLLELRRQSTDLREVCREVVNDRSAGGLSHKLVLIGLESPVVGEWDSDRIYQVIDNLVGNAIKYSPPNAQVTIAVGRDAADESAWVAVSDQGPGIATEDRDRVFSAFFRTQDAAKSQIAGLGLGLYICHELVAAHEGTIDVGPAPSGGASFKVRLPAA